MALRENTTVNDSQLEHIIIEKDLEKHYLQHHISILQATIDQSYFELAPRRIVSQIHLSRELTLNLIFI